MPGRHKLLLPVGGESVIRRTVRTLLAAGPQEVVVVTGCEQRAVEAALAGLAVRLHANPRFEEGQVTSVCAGVAALSRAADAVLICLGDMVLLRPEDYRELIAAFAGHPDKSMLVPCHGGRRGNPVVIAEWRLPEILSGRSNPGCRRLIDENPDDVFVHESEHDRFVLDMDTPEDYASALRRLDADAALEARAHA
jgi:molybdenum cofactor cytidylyltransferase